MFLKVNDCVHDCHYYAHNHKYVLKVYKHFGVYHSSIKKIIMCMDFSIFQIIRKRRWNWTLNLKRSNFSNKFVSISKSRGLKSALIIIYIICHREHRGHRERNNSVPSVAIIFALRFEVDTQISMILWLNLYLPHR